LNDMDTKQSLMKFPCSFPLKVMGPNNEDFTSTVLAVFERRLSPSEFTYTTRQSSSNKYLSITVTFNAQSSDQLNDLYEELNASDLVLMTL
jgi:putative lipoic acid-binding regulatory protein